MSPDETHGGGAPAPPASHDNSPGLSGERAEIERRVEAIEAGYEFLLAYAAQGLPSDAGSSAGAEVREYLRRFDNALTGLADVYRTLVESEKPASAPAVHAFLEVLGRDAATSQAAIQMVLAQPAISSQLVDNLNASIHVRALLTDIFLIDEALKK
jgi:hypothetical protein